MKPLRPYLLTSVSLLLASAPGLALLRATPADPAALLAEAYAEKDRAARLDLVAQIESVVGGSASPVIARDLGYLIGYELGDPVRALPWLEKAEGFDTSPAFRASLAEIRIGAGRVEQGLADFQRLVSEHPEDAEVWVRQADALDRLGRSESALVSYERALALAPDEAGWRAARDQVAARSVGAGSTGGAQSPVPEGRSLLVGEGTWAKTSGYVFEGDDGFEQSGLFLAGGARLGEAWSASVNLSERWFDQSGRGTIDRSEAGLNVVWKPRTEWILAAGGALRDGERDSSQVGAFGSVTWVPRADFFATVSGQIDGAFDESYAAVERDLERDEAALEVEWWPGKLTSLRGKFSHSDLSDGNERRFVEVLFTQRVNALPGLSATLRYDHLDFEAASSVYSAPGNYSRFGPALVYERTVRRIFGLKLEGETLYLESESDWGTRWGVGLDVRPDDQWLARFSYSQHRVPGGPATWSGEGWNAELGWRF
jgi:tetratricopeptide (TPR) repeat protein